MQLKCSRYIFTYTSSPLIVEDFILRADDLASQTYGRDKYFARLNQVLEQARFLGWPLPRFGAELPEELTEIPPPGVDHVFENQAKLLVDVAPTTQVMLEDGRYCPVKMLPGTTAAGDLVWRCHLLSDTEGTPYVQRNQKKYKVKTKGTKIVCQAETLAYDGKYVFECFGGDGGVWPVPFLPEFFSDRAIAQKFSPEDGVVEVVFIHEEIPIKVLAHDVVPWYRPLEINYAKALPANEEFDSDANVVNLIDGWDDLKDNEQIVLNKNKKYPQEVDSDDIASDEDVYEEDDLDGEAGEGAAESAKLTNIITQFTDIEKKKFKEYEKALSGSKIATKAEADKLRNDPVHKDRAEKWLVAAVNRLRIIANCSGKIGALLGLLNKFKDEQVLVIQPRQKWAAKLAQVLQQRGVECQVLDPEKSDKQISRFNDEKIKVLVAAEPQEEMFLDDIVVISVSAFDSPRWLEWLLPSQYAYCIAIKDLDLADHNFIPEHAALTVESEEYSGLAYDILKLDLEAKEESKEEAKESKVIAKEISEVAAETLKVDDTKPAEVKEPKVVRPKFKIKIVGQGQGRPKTAASYEKALEMAQKHEADGKKCEIYGPEGEEPVYITGIGELDK